MVETLSTMAGLEQQHNQLVSKLLRFYSIHTPQETVGSVHVKCQSCCWPVLDGGGGVGYKAAGRLH
eukprot:1833496-Rhodomonas_salina.5